MKQDQTAPSPPRPDDAAGADPLLHHLARLEVELHHPGVRLDAGQLTQRLHPDFHEVGRSGRAYDRATVIAHLAAQPHPPLIVSEGFRLCAVGEGAALLTYRSAQRAADGTLANRTLRSSLWLRTDAGWQLRYHQGTPAAQD